MDATSSGDFLGFILMCTHVMRRVSTPISSTDGRLWTISSAILNPKMNFPCATHGHLGKAAEWRNDADASPLDHIWQLGLMPVFIHLEICASISLNSVMILSGS